MRAKCLFSKLFDAPFFQSHAPNESRKKLPSANSAVGKKCNHFPHYLVPKKVNTLFLFLYVTINVVTAIYHFLSGQANGASANPIYEWLRLKLDTTF